MKQKILKSLSKIFVGTCCFLAGLFAVQNFAFSASAETTNGGAFYVSSSSTLTVDSKKNLSGFTVSGNGGAIYCDGGNVIINGGSIYANTAKTGSAIYAKSGTINMSAGSISENSGGSAVYGASGTFTMSGGSISGNKGTGLDYEGGDVNISGGSFSNNGGDGASFDYLTSLGLSNATFSGNKTFGVYMHSINGLSTFSNLNIVGNGGKGLYYDKARVNMTLENCNIIGNGSDGVYLDNSGYGSYVTLENCVISGNSGYQVSILGGNSKGLYFNSGAIVGDIYLDATNAEINCSSATHNGTVVFSSYGSPYVDYHYYSGQKLSFDVGKLDYGSKSSFVIAKFNKSETVPNLKNITFIGLPTEDFDPAIVKNSDGSYDLMIVQKQKFDKSWKDNLNNSSYMGSNCMKYSDVTGIKFEREIPENYVQIGKYSDEILVFSSILNPTDIAFVSPSEIIASEDCMGLFSELSNLYEISFNNFNTKNVTTMERVFADSFVYSSKMPALDISMLDTSNVKNMQYMFGNSNIGQVIIGSIDTSNVQSMVSMFCGCGRLRYVRDVNINTSNVTDMTAMFYGCESLRELDLSCFDVSKVTDMSEMFGDCSRLKSLDLSSFDMSSVTIFSGMLCFDLSGNNTPKISVLKTPYNNSKELEFTYKKGAVRLYSNSGNEYTSLPAGTKTSLTLVAGEASGSAFFPSDWSTELYDGSKMSTAIRSDAITSIRFKKTVPTDLNYTYNGKLSTGIEVYQNGGTDVAFVYSGSIIAPESCSGLFAASAELTYIEFENFNTKFTTNMASMFQYCTSLSSRSLDFSLLDTSHVTDMSNMFERCPFTTIDLSGWDTRRVQNMAGLFTYCLSLQTVNLSGFDTSNVVVMRDMFSECNSLKSLDLSNFDVKNVKYMESMFLHCNSLEYLDLSSFDLSNYDGSFDGMLGLSTSSNSSQLKILKTPYNIHGVKINIDEGMLKLYSADGKMYDALYPDEFPESITLYYKDYSSSLISSNAISNVEMDKIVVVNEVVLPKKNEWVKIETIKKDDVA